MERRCSTTVTADVGEQHPSGLQEMWLQVLILPQAVTFDKSLNVSELPFSPPTTPQFQYPFQNNFFS